MSSIDKDIDGIIIRSYSGRLSPPDNLVLPKENVAALNQFSLERVMGYGVAYADAFDLRARVAAGQDWMATARELAATCLSPPEGILSKAGPATLASRLYRASALLRMSQMMMLSDSPERHALFSDAARLYADAAKLSLDREKVILRCSGGDVSGWYFTAGHLPPRASVIVIGGVEGWAMDFSAIGLALAARGIAALVLDGPGQGETRLIHGHYLTRRWFEAYHEVVDYLSRRTQGAPVGFVGNSAGGALAVQFSALDPRIAACCDNGGPRVSVSEDTHPLFFRKMATHCGDCSSAEVDAIWRTIVPKALSVSMGCPLLIVHGGRDPLVSIDHAKEKIIHTNSPSKHMVIFSDGDHCVYNHADDRNDLIADWMFDNLVDPGAT